MAKIVKKNAVQKKAISQAQHCPYCDAETKALNLPLCQACGVSISELKKNLLVFQK
jgi:hypothetical protein